MRKIFTRIVLAGTIVFVVTNFSNSQNLVANSGFETGTGTLPDNWSTKVVEGSVDFSWVTDTFYSEKKSICISHSDSATSSFYQVIPALPNSLYKVTAYIKTENVEAGTDWFEGGAQITIEGDVDGYWWDNMTERIFGSSDWTKVELQFYTTEYASSIEVHCKLGAGLKIKGTAWYDDVVIEGEGPLESFFRNGGFEEDTLILNREDPNWKGGWFLEFDEFGSVEKGFVTIDLDTAVFHGGRQSLRFHCIPNQPTGWMQVMQNGGPYPEGFINGARYKVSGWIKTQGDVSHIRMRCGDNGDIGTQLAGDNDWTYREGTVKFDRAFYDMWGFLGITFFKESTENSGTVWYDDIKVELIKDTQIMEHENNLMPSTTELIGNYPNPFNPNTTFVFTNHKASYIKITVFNMQGQKVADVVDQYYQAGKYEINWIANSATSSGVYFYELQAGDCKQVKKMVLMR
ncbi:MAG: T9SS type A sorting domain-containing protein [Bacteroidales bacterium]|nr:T9SS type A sorting domain-containing protein [Bacteroidales bacterium]